MLKDPILEVNGLNLSLLRFMDGENVILRCSERLIFQHLMQLQQIILSILIEHSHTIGISLSLPSLFVS